MTKYIKILKNTVTNNNINNNNKQIRSLNIPCSLFQSIAMLQHQEKKLKFSSPQKKQLRKKELKSS